MDEVVVKQGIVLLSLLLLLLMMIMAMAIVMTDYDECDAHAPVTCPHRRRVLVGQRRGCVQLQHKHAAGLDGHRDGGDIPEGLVLHHLHHDGKHAVAANGYRGHPHVPGRQAFARVLCSCGAHLDLHDACRDRRVPWDSCGGVNAQPAPVHAGGCRRQLN